MATQPKLLGRGLATALLSIVSASTAQAAESPTALRADQVAISRDHIDRVEASSTSGATVSGRHLFRASNLADGRDWSAWGSTPEETKGAWVKVVFRGVEYVDRVEWVPGDGRDPSAFAQCGRPARLRVEGGGETRIIDVPDRRWQQVIPLEPPLGGNSLRITFEAVHGRSETGGVCLSELKLAGPRDPLAAFPALATQIAEAIGYLADDQRFERGRALLLAIGAPAVNQVIAATDPANPHLASRALDVLGRLGGPGAIAAAAARIDERDATVRNASLWALGALRSAAHYERIRAWYDLAAGSARDRAFDALARGGDARALDAVIAELLGGSPARKQSAEENLGLFGPEAVTALRPLLASPVKTERAAALRALGSVDLPDAHEILMANLSGATDSELRAAAIHALARRGDLAARDAIVSLWDSRYLIERRAVAEALGAFGQAEDLDTLDLMTSDASMSVRQAAASSLGRLGEPAWARLRRLSILGPDGGTAIAAARVYIGAESPVEPVVDLLGSRHHEVRRFAARQLGERGNAGQAALVAALVSPEAPIRTAAAVELKKVGHRALPELLARAADAPEVAWADILRLVTLFGDPLAVDLAARMMVDARDLVVRRLAVEAVAACGTPEQATTPLIAALQDKAVEVRLAAVVAIGEKKVSAATAAVVEQLQSPNRELAHAAVLTLGQLREQAAVDALAALYRAKVQEVDDPTFRQDIVATLGRIGGERSLPVLMDAMGDRDVRVRFAAQDALY